MATTIEQMEKKLLSINFFIGGLTDEGIIYYYKKYFEINRLTDEV